MILWHPCYDPAIVLTNALGSDGGLFLLALSAFGIRVFAMATATSLAHLEGIFGSEVLAASFDRASTERWDGGCEGGRRLKVDVIWVVIHPDAGWAQAGGWGWGSKSGARLSATTAQRRRYSPFGVVITHTFPLSPLKYLPFSVIRNLRCYPSHSRSCLARIRLSRSVPFSCPVMGIGSRRSQVLSLW
jgi:hypothetical protein